MGILFAPVLLILLAVFIVTSTLGSAFSQVAGGGSIAYDEATFQEYADAEYAKAFGNSSAYEDNILILFLTNEECDGYYCISWVGDNIQASVNDLFGDESTAFGKAVVSSVNSDYYAYSLDSNLARVMEIMGDRIEALGLSSSYRKEYDHSTSPDSHMVNYTDLDLTASTVDDALEDFTDRTGIPTVIAVQDMEAVFGRTLPLSSIIIVVAAVALIGVAIYMIVKGMRERKQGEE